MHHLVLREGLDSLVCGLCVLFYCFCRRQCSGEGSKIGEVSSQTVALSTVESDAINELLAAYRKSLEIQMDKDVPRDRANLADLVNIAELSVRRVIAMAKQVCSLGSFCILSYYPAIIFVH